MGIKIIVCDVKECMGCRICDYICSAVSEGVINPRKSRIRTIRIHPTFDLAVSCRKCEEPKCVLVCPHQAISQDKRTGLITIDEKKCDCCGWCIEKCPIGAIILHLEDKTAKVCDFCQEYKKPQCVEYCPKEALKYLDISRVEKDSFQRMLQDLIECKLKLEESVLKAGKSG